eukprot:TRINITY_DN4934_c0_g1_i1.p1 TRINITY_DN4934_c0_g1~~TRINITY_DN4934_c0_g1_i1.p1  ORF type:complete len:353 (-),score=44.11 TRINITY_DN4934_c0_g1_i1:36-1094(-)
MWQQVRDHLPNLRSSSNGIRDDSSGSSDDGVQRLDDATSITHMPAFHYFPNFKFYSLPSNSSNAMKARATCCLFGHVRCRLIMSFLANIIRTLALSLFILASTFSMCITGDILPSIKKGGDKAGSSSHMGGVEADACVGVSIVVSILIVLIWLCYTVAFFYEMLLLVWQGRGKGKRISDFRPKRFTICHWKFTFGLFPLCAFLLAGFGILAAGFSSVEMLRTLASTPSIKGKTDEEQTKIAITWAYEVLVRALTVAGSFFLFKDMGTKLYRILQRDYRYSLFIEEPHQLVPDVSPNLSSTELASIDEDEKSLDENYLLTEGGDFVIDDRLIVDDEDEHKGEMVDVELGQAPS